MTNILDRWNTHYARCHTITDSEALGQELAQEVERLRHALVEVRDDCKLRAVKGVVPIGRSAWIALCAALQHDKGEE